MNKWVENMIRRHEGYREDVYRDIKGNPTGGFGHYFEVGSKLPREIWEQIFQFDIKKAEEIVAALKIPDGILNEVRKGVLIDMAFNLGNNLYDFKATLAAIRSGDYQTASQRMEKTLWARQVGQRATELAQLMLTGELPKGFI